jgi:hypothetical protein
MATQALFDIGNVILDPTPTFTRLKTKTHAWLPLVVLIVLSVGIMFWWIATVDFAWLTERMLAAQPKATPEMRAAMGRFLTPTTMMLSTGFGAVVGQLGIFALSAAYYLVAGKLLGSTIGYGKWFGFSVWTSIPRLLTVPLSALQIMTSHGRVAMEDLNMVSLNYLALHLPASSPWAAFAGAIDVSVIWSIVLTVIGLKAWTGRSTAACAAVALLPSVVVYGLWAAKIALMG